MSEKPVVLIISGIDPTNGAGLGRDIITVRDNGGFPVSVPSALTVQNSISFNYSEAVDFKYIRNCVEALEKEFTFSAIKTGLLPLDEIWIGKLAEMLRHFSVPIVIDPVLKATADKTKDLLIPDSYINMISGSNKIITPNLKELELIYRKMTGKKETQKKMAENISNELFCTVVTTFEGKEPVINMTDAKGTFDIQIELFELNRSVHGTGCTFSSALATELGKGLELTESVKNAACYVTGKIKKAVIFKESGQYLVL